MRAILEVTVREQPYPLLAGSGSALAIWVQAPPEVVIPAALLVCLYIRVRFVR